MKRNLVILSLVFSVFAMVAMAQDGKGPGKQKNKRGNQGNGPQGGQIQQGGTNAFDSNAFADQMLQRFDQDQDGKLDRTELSSCLNALAQEVRHQQMAQGGQPGQPGGAGFGGAGGQGGGAGGAGGQGGAPGGSRSGPSAGGRGGAGGGGVGGAGGGGAGGSPGGGGGGGNGGRGGGGR